MSLVCVPPLSRPPHYVLRLQRFRLVSLSLCLFSGSLPFFLSIFSLALICSQSLIVSYCLLLSLIVSVCLCLSLIVSLFVCLCLFFYFLGRCCSLPLPTRCSALHCLIFIFLLLRSFLIGMSGPFLFSLSRLIVSRHCCVRHPFFFSIGISRSRRTIHHLALLATHSDQFVIATTLCFSSAYALTCYP